MSTVLDGNALAGPLGAILRQDPTTARGRCGSCGRVGVLAEARVYVAGPGLVARCSGCGGVLLRLVTAGAVTRVDLRGLGWLQPAADPPDGPDREPPGRD